MTSQSQSFISIAAEESKFATRPRSRPMLARDADSMYWMGRYCERAEHVSRLLWVTSNLLVDVGDLAPPLQTRQWQSLLTIMRLDEMPPANTPLAQRVAQYMTFNADNPNSIISCLTRARENARGIREDLSSEMWECLNLLYWNVQSDETASRFEEAPDDVWRQIMTGVMLFQGLTDQTIAHDQRWLFVQLAKLLERIDVTARVIEMKYTLLRGAEATLETPLRNIHWMAVLRSCCSLEPYRRQHIGDLDPLRVASFLILEPNYPRSIRYCVREAHRAIAAIRGEVSPHSIDPAERILGRLVAQLEFAEMGEILAAGLTKYLQDVQNSVAEVALAVQKSYFLH